VLGNVGGYDSGSAPYAIATPAASSHTAGSALGPTTATAIGGIWTIPLLRTAGGGAILTQLQMQAIGGDAASGYWYLFDRLPTNSGFTCEDATAFAFGSSTGYATDRAHLITPPFTMTLAALGQATGDAASYQAQGFTPPISVHNQDGTPAQNIYGCFKLTAILTPSGSPFIVNASGPQD
jgi:hypothetical protein